MTLYFNWLANWISCVSWKMIESYIYILISRNLDIYLQTERVGSFDYDTAMNTDD